MAKVLLVEDDNNLREIYEARLLGEGYEVITSKDGEDALSLIKQHEPDLVISDVMMPRISGFEMLDILRNTSGIKQPKVILLTALGQAEDQAHADNIGADVYLIKSQVTLEDIVKAADQLTNPSAVVAPDTPAETAQPEPEPQNITIPEPSFAPAATSPAPEPVAATPEPAAQPEPAIEAEAPAAAPNPVLQQPVEPVATVAPAVDQATPVVPVAPPAEPVVQAVPVPTPEPEPTVAPAPVDAAAAPADPVAANPTAANESIINEAAETLQAATPNAVGPEEIDDLPADPSHTSKIIAPLSAPSEEKHITELLAEEEATAPAYGTPSVDPLTGAPVATVVSDSGAGGQQTVIAPSNLEQPAAGPAPDVTPFTPNSGGNANTNAL